MQDHPVRRNLGELTRILTDTVELPVELMPTRDKRAALEDLAAVTARLDYLRLRLIGASDDLADQDGSRDIAAWLTTHTRTDRATNARHQRLAHVLDTWPAVAAALAAGLLQLPQAETIVGALQALPDDLPPELVGQAEEHLVDQAAEFGPRELRLLGRKVLDVIAPEIGEHHELRLLQAEEEHALATTSLTSHRHGDGTTTIRIKLPDASADRLLTYLDAFTAPRQAEFEDELRGDQRLGNAFCALLEHLDPTRLPQHGGDATTVLITIDLATLQHGLGTATLGPDTPITAREARRLACTAKLIPAVLGTDSEPLDLGRTARLFNTPQRKAMRLRRSGLPSRRMHRPRDLVRSPPFRQPLDHRRQNQPRRRQTPLHLAPPPRPRRPLPPHRTTQRRRPLPQADVSLPSALHHDRRCSRHPSRRPWRCPRNERAERHVGAFGLRMPRLPFTEYPDEFPGRPWSTSTSATNGAAVAAATLPWRLTCI